MKTLLWCLTLAGLLGFSAHAEERQTGTPQTKVETAKSGNTGWLVAVQMYGERSPADGFRSASMATRLQVQDGKEETIGRSGMTALKADGPLANPGCEMTPLDFTGPLPLMGGLLLPIRPFWDEGEGYCDTQSFWLKVQNSKNKLLVEIRVAEETSIPKNGRTTRTVSNRSRSVDGVSPGDKLTLDLGKDENTGWQYKFNIEVFK